MTILEKYLRRMLIEGDIVLATEQASRGWLGAVLLG